MSGAAAYLTEALDRREAAAKAATPGPWRLTENEWDGKHITAADGETVMNVYAMGPDAPRALENAHHIAAHDPEWTLRDVAAKRKILEQYERARVNDRDHPDDFASKGAFLALYGAAKSLAEAEGWTDEA